MSRHDAFVRQVLSDLNTAREFMRLFMKPVVEHLDLSRLEMRSDSFVDENLDKTATDLLYHAPWQDRSDAYVAMIVEHKSEGAARATGEHLPLQLRGQEIDLLRQHRRNHPKEPIPLVMLVALYHGAKPYRGPLTVGESMALDEQWIPERWKHQDMTLIDLAELNDAQMTTDKLGLFLRVLKHIYDDNFLELYQKLVPALQKLDQSIADRSFVIALNRYLVTSANMENMAKFTQIAVESYSEETGGIAMTLYESAKREGRNLEREMIVRNMLQKGLDYETIAFYTALSVEEVQMMAKKAS
jgi:predicted transposase YdaD